MKNKKWLITLIAVLAVAGVSTADFTEFGAPGGFMNVFNNDAGTQGAYQWGSGWGIPELRADLTTNGVLNAGGSIDAVLYPNQNTYTDSLVGNDGDRAYWTDSADGGITAGNDGNKWMEANLSLQRTLDGSETDGISFTYSVDAFTLDPRYSVRAYIKAFTGDFSGNSIDYYDITGTVGSTTVTFTDAAWLVAGNHIQVGFDVNGLNANPATDWGSATVSFDDVSVIPEPATMGLIGLFGGGMMFVRRFVS